MKKRKNNRSRKVPLEEKLCLVCGRVFSWRKKWERDWSSVKYCSMRCKIKKFDFRIKVKKSQNSGFSWNPNDGIFVIGEGTEDHERRRGHEITTYYDGRVFCSVLCRTQSMGSSLTCLNQSRHTRPGCLGIRSGFH